MDAELHKYLRTHGHIETLNFLRFIDGAVQQRRAGKAKDEVPLASSTITVGEYLEVCSTLFDPHLQVLAESDTVVRTG
jgi:hypothetical protein